MMEAALEAEAAAAPAEVPADATEPESDEIEIDLDEVFVLDMDDDDEPSSQVKPPPDMAGEGLRLGSAWAPAESEAPAAAAPVEEAFPEIEIELEPEQDLAPAPDTFDSIALPSLEASGSIYLEVEEPDLPSLDSGSWGMQPQAEEAPPAGPSTGTIDADFLERTAASLHPKEIARDEDLVSEAEVLAKYGLEEKALERLSEALQLKPHNLAAYGLMIQIHLAKERHGRVVELANAMARAAGEIHDTQAWPRMRKELISAGYRLDGDRVVSGPHGFDAAPPPPPAPADVFVEIESLPEIPGLVDLTEIGQDVEIEEAEAPAPEPMAEPEPAAIAAPEPPPPVAAAPEPEPAPAPAAPPPAAPRKRSADIDQMLRGLLDEKPKRPAAPRPAASPSTPPAPQAPPPAAPAPPAPARPAMFNPLEIGEMIEQEEDFEWGPASADASVPPLPPLPTPPVSPALPASGAGFSPGLEDTGSGSWLDEADRGRQVKSPASDSLFDEEDDFFDLAAQLEQELSQEDLFQGGEHLLVQPAEQSLEEIVEGFKKGVAEHLSPTDYDTHFNLGIAYREMGLLDEAIGEFQIAAKDPRHLVLCCSMLGLCFLDKGLPELAVKT
jgi:tetratricopeptide (TPR) repeat protein